MGIIADTLRKTDPKIERISISYVGLIKKVEIYDKSKGISYNDREFLDNFTSELKISSENKSSIVIDPFKNKNSEKPTEKKLDPMDPEKDLQNLDSLLKEFTSLKELSVKGRIHTDIKLAEAIVNIIKKSKTIQKLDLSDNKFSMAEVRIILEAIEQNISCPITDLNISYNKEFIIPFRDRTNRQDFMTICGQIKNTHIQNFYIEDFGYYDNDTNTKINFEKNTGRKLIVGTIPKNSSLKEVAVHKDKMVKNDLPKEVPAIITTTLPQKEEEPIEEKAKELSIAGNKKSTPSRKSTFASLPSFSFLGKKSSTFNEKISAPPKEEDDEIARNSYFGTSTVPQRNGVRLDSPKPIPAKKTATCDTPKIQHNGKGLIK